MARTIAIGDVHGCLEELQELLEKLRLSEEDHLILLGDLVDRGPFPVETVRFVRELVARRAGRTTVLQGNHEQKCTKWRLREAQRLATGRENKMRPPGPERKAQWDQFSDEEVEWIRDLPVYAHLEDNWLAVHGGLVPGLPLEDQDPDKVMRIRTLYPDTLKVGQQTDESAPLEDPPDTVWWSSLWKGPWSVVYGHAVNKGSGHAVPTCLEYPRIDRLWSESRDMIACAGIDTGCVFGGRLTAVELSSNGGVRTFQVQARRQYAVLGQTR